MATNKLKIVLAQMDIVGENKSVNQLKCAQIAVQAVKNDAELLIFPEMTLVGFSADVRKIAEETNGPTVKFFSDLAKKNKINIIFGVVTTHKNNKLPQNEAVAVDKNGKILAGYAKIHPFSFSKEDKKNAAGEKIAIFKINNLKIALAVCYDLRFPGLFEVFAKKGVEMVVVIANWPTRRIAEWDTLLAARALDISGYLVGVNRVGKDGSENYNGHSAVYDPEGNCLQKFVGEINGQSEVLKDLVTKRRECFTSLKDKKYSLYKKLCQ
jgi:predicted amidohydrolase